MTDRQVQSINPATGEVIESFTPLSAPGIDAALNKATAAFRAWRNVPLNERSALLNRAADVLEARAAEYTRDITLEMGKPLSQAVAEVQKCASVCRHYADHGPAYMQDETYRPRHGAPSCATCRWARSLPSCRGTSPSGRSSASPRRP